ncbi:hypothetical protein MTO96_001345 [Rhipicephalus appendiculatus]
MSVAFAQQQKGRHNPSPAQIQKMLDENSQLIQAIVDYQNKGKASECLQYQQILHRNLVYLASVADAGPVVQASLPPPCGPGGPDQGGSPATGGLMPGQQSYGPSMQSQQQAAPGGPGAGQPPMGGPWYVWLWAIWAATSNLQHGQSAAAYASTAATSPTANATPAIFTAAPSHEPAWSTATLGPTARWPAHGTAALTPISHAAWHGLCTPAQSRPPDASAYSQSTGARSTADAGCTAASIATWWAAPGTASRAAPWGSSTLVSNTLASTLASILANILVNTQASSIQGSTLANTQFSTPVSILSSTPGNTPVNTQDSTQVHILANTLVSSSHILASHTQDSTLASHTPLRPKASILASTHLNTQYPIQHRIQHNTLRSIPARHSSHNSHLSSSSSSNSIPHHLRFPRHPVAQVRHSNRGPPLLPSSITRHMAAKVH